MSLHHQVAFIRELAPRLPLFEEQGEKFVFRCPFCGDSKKNPYMRRGGLFPDRETRSSYMFKCFNCGLSMGFENFLKSLDPALHGRYKLSLMGRSSAALGALEPLQAPETKPIVHMNAQPVTELESDHPAVEYLVERCIPRDRWDEIEFTRDFEVMCGRKSKGLDWRLVWPMRDEDGSLFGFQGRTIPKGYTYKGSLKYMTHIADGARFRKSYGLHRLDRNKTVWVTEAIIDSLFLPNSLASLDANLGSFARHQMLSKPQTILVFDNQPRNPEVVKQMESALTDGWSVGFWPKAVYDKGKDINDLVLAGAWDRSKLQVACGPEAQMLLAQWRRG